MGKKILVVAVLASFGTLAFAQSSGFYAGVGLGQSHSDFDSSYFKIPGYTDSADGNQGAWKLFAGYSFTSNWAAEAAYTDFGRAEYKWFDATGSGKQRRDDSAWSLAIKGTLPLNEQFQVFAKLGATSNTNDTYYDESYAGVYRAAKGKDTKTETLYGVGAEYLPMKNVGIRLEYENFGTFSTSNDSGRTNMDLWSISAVYRY